jgi:putative ABC transport system ATP-binding protein
MQSPFICIENLRKSYPMGREIVHALAGVDVDIEPNSFMAIIGPSGSGKSTLLHLIGGLDRPTAGSIHMDGKHLEEMDENALAGYRRRKVGFVFQSFNLIPNMNTLENVAFPLRFDGVSKRKRESCAWRLLEMVELSHRAYHLPSELSGGQQQRAAIARALVHDPQLILADEPTGNLDTRSSMHILELLSNLHKEGHSVIVVSHDPRVTGFATHTTCLLDGRVVDLDEYNAALTVATSEADIL